MRISFSDLAKLPKPKRRQVLFKYALEGFSPGDKVVLWWPNHAELHGKIGEVRVKEGPEFYVLFPKSMISKKTGKRVDATVNDGIEIGGAVKFMTEEEFLVASLMES